MTKHSRRTPSSAVLVALLLSFASSPSFAKDRPGTQRDKDTPEETTVTETLQLLARRCLECHDADVAEGGYVMATLGALKESGDSGNAAVVAGDAEASELFRRLVSEDSEERMPAGGPALSPNEIEQVKHWIDSGAKTGRLAPEQSLSEIATVEPVTHPAPNVYPRPIPVIGLAPGFFQVDNLKNATVVVGGYHELLWGSAKDDQRRRLAGFGRFIAAIKSHPQQQQFAVAHGEPGVRGRVTLVQVEAEENPTLSDCWSGTDLPGDIAFSPDGKRLAVGGLDGALSVIEVDSGELVFSSTPHADAILDVAWSAEGQHVLTASRDRTARAVRLEDGRAISNYTSHERAVFAVASIGAGTLTLDETGTLRLWSEGSRQPRIQRQLDRSAAVGMVVHNDQIYVAEPQQIIRTRVGSKEVSDGKDKDGNPKTKTVPEWEDESPLTLDASRIITSLAIAEDGTVWAGTHDGMLYSWRDGERTEPFQAFPQ